jgi:hypothetical protein
MSLLQFVDSSHAGMHDAPLRGTFLIPVSQSKVEEVLGFKLKLQEQDGLGPTYSSICEVDGGTRVLVECYEFVPGKVRFYLDENKTEAGATCRSIFKAFGVDAKSGIWPTYSGNGSHYQLCRFDDNENEFMMFEYNGILEAKYWAAVYAAKGHKQVYWVREKI